MVTKSPAGFEVEIIYSLEQPPQGKQPVNEYFLRLQGHHYCRQPLVPLPPHHRRVRLFFGIIILFYVYGHDEPQISVADSLFHRRPLLAAAATLLLLIV